MKDRIINISVTGEEVTLVVEAEDKLPRQQFTIPFDDKLKAVASVRLAIACNAPGVLHLLTPLIHPNDMQLTMVQDEPLVEEHKE